MPLLRSLPPLGPSPAPRPQRYPAGYLGRNHETLGSDILAVVEALQFPTTILGPERTRRVNKMVATAWYPIAELLEILAILDQRFGSDGLRKLGKTLFQRSHQQRTSSATLARDVVYGINDMYHFANRGDDIGGWTVVQFSSERAELHKNTPHHCHMEEGILLAAFGALQPPVQVRIDQPRCFWRGGDSCLLVITPALPGQRWSDRGPA